MSISNQESIQFTIVVCQDWDVIGFDSCLHTNPGEFEIEMYYSQSRFAMGGSQSQVML